MKILYFITGLELGGAEVITVDLANFFSNGGHSVTVVYLTGENLLSDKISPNVSIVPIKLKKNIFSFIYALNIAVRLIKKIKPDVIHSHMIHANIFARLTRLFVKFPRLICTEHNIYIGGKLRLLAYRVTKCLSDLDTNVSSEATDYFIAERAFSASKSKVMYNGVDLKKIYKRINTSIRTEFNIRDEDFLFLNVGRLTEAKNQKILIEAMANIRDCKLIICGKGHLEYELLELIKQYNLSDRVFLAGARKNIADFYSAADCFILSSSWEGLPMVILESMAYGLPIITTNVGGANETIPDASCVIPPDDIYNLVKSINRMKNETQDQRKLISDANLKAVEKFDINVICEEWKTIYMNKSKEDYLN
jgi:glycosyltransferase involved in cell wall biosynthesis